MKASTYRKRIINCMEGVGTYKPEFDKTIDTLSRIYEDMDIVRQQFEESGGEIVVEHTNKNRSTNIVKNPYFLAIEGLQNRILKYNSELGLTPAGYKKIKGEALKDDKKKGGLLEALQRLEG